MFTGLPGIYVPVGETVEAFEALNSGELDHVPEQAFFNVGGVESVLEKSEALQGVEQIPRWKCSSYHRSRCSMSARPTW